MGMIVFLYDIGIQLNFWAIEPAAGITTDILIVNLCKIWDTISELNTILLDKFHTNLILNVDKKVS